MHIIVSVAIGFLFYVIFSGLLLSTRTAEKWIREDNDRFHFCMYLLTFASIVVGFLFWHLVPPGSFY